MGKDGAIYLIDQARGRFEAPELEKVECQFWAKRKNTDAPGAGRLTAMMVEDKVSGTGLIQQLGRGAGAIPVSLGARFVVQSDRPIGRLPDDLIAHARPVSGETSPFHFGDDRGNFGPRERRSVHNFSIRQNVRQRD